MFRDERIYLFENKERTVKLSDDVGKVVALIFINSDRIIIKGDLVALESSIKAPIIESL